MRPSKYMSDYVDFTLNQLGLTKKGYGVIHIRTGDESLLDNNYVNITLLDKVTKLLKKIIKQDRRYLIISDSNIFKKTLKEIPNFYIYIRKNEHLGGEVIRSTQTNGIMNTMLDFFLIGHSNSVLSLSVYSHVSGFSKYASIINNVPFTYVKL